MPAPVIAAIATAPGRAGIGVVRVSGGDLVAFARALTGKTLLPRQATFCTFRNADGLPVDQGIAIYFKAPHSYTGEDVLELQGHGGNIVMQSLLRRCLELGARLAEPGEFTRRAFLNDRLDLAQAEAVVDLIDAASVEAARSAMRSLSGEFSLLIGTLVQSLVELRVHVEACIDFPEEDISLADRARQEQKLEAIKARLERVLLAARQGVILREGLTVVLIGRPNVGKSTLLNKLAGEDLAIVTPIPGTTRDQVRATISIDGMPIHLIDTAGLHETNDPVEKIGMERTWQATHTAGAVMLISEVQEGVGSQEEQILASLPEGLRVLRVYNKIDLYGIKPALQVDGNMDTINLSAVSGEGVDLLRTWLHNAAGWKPQDEGVFMARERHIQALHLARDNLVAASQNAPHYELFAEDLRLAQSALSSITGEFTPDDLLGEVFQRFCIGK